MTFSAELYQENIGKNEPLPKRARAYFQQRFQQQVFARLAKAFSHRAEEFGISKSCLAALVDKDKAQINRVLAHPTNLTLDTLSEILFALNYEPNVLIEDLSAPAMHNYCHPAYINRQGLEIHSMQFETEPPQPSRIRITANTDWHLEPAQ